MATTYASYHNSLACERLLRYSIVVHVKTHYSSSTRPNRSDLPQLLAVLYIEQLQELNSLNCDKGTGVGSVQFVYLSVSPINQYNIQIIVCAALCTRNILFY